MSDIKDKYRGTTVYFHVKAELVRAAQYRGLTTYQDIAVIMGIPTWGSYMGAATGQMLRELCEDEVAAGRPMLSAVAVTVDRKVGPGFFALAKTLGLLREGEDETTFWERERDRTYEAWKRPLPKRD